MMPDTRPALPSDQLQVIPQIADAQDKPPIIPKQIQRGLFFAGKAAKRIEEFLGQSGERRHDGSYLIPCRATLPGHLGGFLELAVSQPVPLQNSPVPLPLLHASPRSHVPDKPVCLFSLQASLQPRCPAGLSWVRYHRPQERRGTS